MIGSTVVVVLFGALAVGCSMSHATGEVPAPSDAGTSDAQPLACAFPSDSGASPSATCPAACTRVLGRQLESGCLRDVLVGCADCSKGCGGPLGEVCWVSTRDGRTVASMISTTFENDGWRLCTDDELLKVRASPTCQP